MTYTRDMYGMPSPKLGERTGYFQCKEKPAGALAASCIVQKCWEELHAAQEEEYRIAVKIFQGEMDKSPVKKSGPKMRKFLRTIGFGWKIRREDVTAEDKAHAVFPDYEELDDEEYNRRAQVVPYPYHTPASKRAFDVEMAFREQRRAQQFAERFGINDSESSDSESEAESTISDSCNCATLLNNLVQHLCRLYDQQLSPIIEQLDALPEIDGNCYDDAQFGHLILRLVETREVYLGGLSMVVEIAEFSHDSGHLATTWSQAESSIELHRRGDLGPINVGDPHHDAYLWFYICLKNGSSLAEVMERELYVRSGIAERKHTTPLVPDVQACHNEAADGFSEGIRSPSNNDQSGQPERTEDNKNVSEDAHDADGDNSDGIKRRDFADGNKSRAKKNYMARIRFQPDVPPRARLEVKHMDTQYAYYENMSEEEERFVLWKRREANRLARETAESKEIREQRQVQQIQEANDRMIWLTTRASDVFDLSPRTARPGPASQYAPPEWPGEQTNNNELPSGSFDYSKMKCFSAGPHHQAPEDDLPELAPDNISRAASLLAHAILENGLVVRTQDWSF
ncbi:hypothetical protein AUEXF2481DRAFT_24663 [Aureobasidium subglaciale EXF-2481]|uniref:Uncharacterized protein n=1 Tax=Aureobasidium subglaciale (strain EXF-2481) TaxID=1043005 RepID=A0A074YRL3_AURSE|nr:uncharacterized protein AUEXF2481DRAFT_24663 [Aureobasidium subglaciale EXF-2481]KAI5212253.1 hypothetical protein E4T38_00661 [Aureobasidium subglaciale]KAI5231160.1 hypothetical protein E4T40_00662 [Aureobasidium subglaciale]KAI5234160.1 hypothetical protein E4T41_00660 [Aureobasidium subglaciale]KAI5267666.1 hypothetical protein E4T46_00660 [Aureobasidium subglaciale]KER00321.1 hypothetical protein AUEXF2481DRAFT_24663 [Aureobasidium subglaciale EXF-2481]